MAGEKNFVVKNGLSIGTTEVITSSGKVTSAALSSNTDFTEQVQDIVGAFITGTGSTTVTYNDAGDALTISSTGKTEEEIQDIVGAQLVTNGSHTNITASYDDAGDGAVDLSIADSVIRGKISVTDSGGDGSLAYDNSTGVITYTGPSAAEVQAHITAGTGVSISSGAVSIGQAVGTSDSPTFAGMTLTGASTVSGHILPSADVTYDLGSSSYQWRDIYVGPGSLYVNGQKVLEDNSGTIVVSADSDQNLQIKTAGSGDIEFNPSGTGIIQAKGTLQMLDGELITNSAGNAVAFGNNITVDQITSRSADTNLVLSGNGTGNVTLNDSVNITGNLTVSGTTTTVNSETISLADNIIALNSNFTSGVPTEDSGISITRGGSAAKTFLWDETNDRWTVGSDSMVAGTFIGGLTGNVTGNADSATTLTGLTSTVAELNYSDGVTSNIQTQLDAKQAASTALTTSTTFGGDVSGTYNAIVIADDSHNHIIGNVDGLQSALDAKYGSGSNATLGTITTSNASNAGGYVRNIYQSTSTPSSGDGAVGDLWVYYA